MDSRDLISKRHGRAAALALVAILALASLGQTIFFVAQAGAVISVGDCIEYDDSWVDCEEHGGDGGGGGGDGGGIGDGGGVEGGGIEIEMGGEEGGGLTPEEEESIEIETGNDEGIEIESGDEESGGLTPEEEESIEIETGDEGPTETAREREERAEEKVQEDFEFEKEWEEEIEEEEKSKALAQKKQEVIGGLRKQRADEAQCSNYLAEHEAGKYLDCKASEPPQDWITRQSECKGAEARLLRDQRRGKAGKGGQRVLGVEQCNDEVLAASTGARCEDLGRTRDVLLGPHSPTTSVDEELVSCLNDLGTYRQDAMGRAKRIRELQERGKSKKPHRARHRQ